MSSQHDAPFSDLLGKTLTHVTQLGDDALHFLTDDGTRYAMYHNQDCCESVTIESIVGDLEDLCGSPILVAEEVTSDENPVNASPEITQYQDSFTWTFYKLATRKGYVDIRWYGGSNGYYSESVEFSKEVPNEGRKEA